MMAMISGWVLWRLYLCSPSADHRHSCYYAQTEVDFYLLCICVFVYFCSSTADQRCSFSRLVFSFYALCFAQKETYPIIQQMFPMPG